MTSAGPAAPPVRRSRARAERGGSAGAALARTTGGIAIGVVFVVGLALQLQLIVMSEAALPEGVQRPPPIPEDLERVNVEISRTGEVWLDGRRLGAWVRDDVGERWVGGDVGYEIDRLRALVPGLEIQIDFEEDTPPDLIWRVVNQVGLDHLLQPDPEPAAPAPRAQGRSA